MSKYPNYIKPSTAFLVRLEKEQDPQWVVTFLEFIQWSQKRFSAKWMQGAAGMSFAIEMNVGGKEETLGQIENRIVRALKPDGKI